MKFGSNHFQHLAPLPEDLCVPSRSHTPQPGGRGGCEIVPAGEGGEDRDGKEITTCMKK